MRRDLYILTGVLLSSYGASLVHYPAGFIMSGLLIFWLGVR